MMWIFLLLALAQANNELIDSLKFKPDMVTKESILRDHQLIKEDLNVEKNEKLVQLAYVTPWNPRGYNLAVKTAHKLSHVSPVWFQAKPSHRNGLLYSCEIQGTHEINRDWLKKLKRKNPKVKIVPRIIFEGWSAQDMKDLLMGSQISRACFEDISNFYSRNQFDGAVVEIYMQSLMSVQSLEIKGLIIESVEELTKYMKKFQMETILTVPAPLDGNTQFNQLVTPDDFKKLSGVADYVQIMTYDYHSDKPAGVAPLNWFKSCILYLLYPGAGPKTIAGLNFYGYEFGNKGVEAITTDRYLKLLKSKKSTLEFDLKSMEHRLDTPSSLVYFPSLTSLELRINTTKRYEIGIAIWDYGQGLDYFTDLL